MLEGLNLLESLLVCQKAGSMCRPWPDIVYVNVWQTHSTVGVREEREEREVREVREVREERGIGAASDNPFSKAPVCPLPSPSSSNRLYLLSSLRSQNCLTSFYLSPKVNFTFSPLD